MTNNEKLEKIKKLADDMYYAAANLGPNVGSGERLHKTMEEYHKFIIHEYNKKEPKFKVGDYIKPVDSCLGSPRTIVEVCDSWYVTNQGTIDFEYEDNWELVEKYNITGIKSRHATGKLKECIDNQTEEGLEQARKQLEEESKAKFKVGDKVMYLNEEYVITDNKDHYTLQSTKERTSVPVVHIDFGNEDYELRLVEESKKCMYTKDNYTDEDRKVLCDSCEEECEYAQKEADWLQELHSKLDSLSKEDFEKVWAKYHQKEEPVSIWHDVSEPPIIDKTFLLVAPNGNSSLCLWGGKELHSVTIGGGHSVLCKGDIYSYIDDLLNFDNSYNFGKNLQKEPVSEDLEKAAESYAKFERSDGGGGIDVTRLDAFIEGAQWHKEHFEKNRLKHCNSITNEQAELEQGFIDQHLDKYNCMPSYLDAVEYGIDYGKQQMMANAVDTTVHIDNGNYPYIPQMELYDYDKDIPLAREGDKYKVVLIKGE